MNIYVAVDCEGISGVYDWSQTRFNGENYNEGRAYMTADINALVEGLKEAGVDKIYVRDLHGRGKNAVWDKLSPLADYYIIGSSGPERHMGLEECDGMILLGYHAMAGSSGAVLNHTWSGVGIQNMWINGHKGGEVLLEAAIAGDYGKPIIMVTGDDKVCAEAKELLPWIVTAEVKRGISPTGAFLLPQARAHALIKEKAKEAIDNFSRMKIYSISKPVTMRIETTQCEMSPSEALKGYTKIIDNRTYEVTGESMNEALYRAL